MSIRKWSGLGLVIAVLMCVSVSWAAQKKVLFIDAYHEGYAWSDGEVQGAKDTIGNKAEFKVIRMDTKRNGSEDFKKQAALQVKAVIESYKPDVVIAADDNPSKYVIVPYYKDSNIPFVFIGVNWDASSYGFPWPNVTGVLEVSVVKPLIEMMRTYAKGDRLGFIGKDNETDRKEADNWTKKYGVALNTRFVNTFEEWKAAYKELNDQCDMLFVVNNAGIKDWNDAEAKAFVREVTKIPTSSSHDFIAPFVLIDYAKLAEEQGEIGAEIALQILNGKSPKDIPVTNNKKGQTYVNLPIAKKLGIKFTPQFLRSCKVINE
ncbi:MAG: ABC transporter substrate binding protein [Candidatus Omnitrophota bacterium]